MIPGSVLLCGGADPGPSMGWGNATGLHFGLGDSPLRSVLIRWPDGVGEDGDVPGNARSEVAPGAR